MKSSANKFIIRFDDVHPRMASASFELLEKIAIDEGIPILLGVIPDCQDASLIVDQVDNFWARLLVLKEYGAELSLHGETHIYANKNPGVLGLNRNSEFAGLTYELQKQKIENGLRILAQQGITPEVFMAPSHSYDENTIKALHDCGIKYITDGYSFMPWDSGQVIFVPQLFASFKTLLSGIYTTCIHADVLSSKQKERLFHQVKDKKADIIPFMQAVENRVKLYDGNIVGKLGVKLFMQQFRASRNFYNMINRLCK